jgi:hypothetical protein
MSILENDISQAGHRYLEPNLVDKKEENKPNVTPNSKLIKIE